MSNNPYVAYYVNQVGSGISHYQGTKYQRGNGFFSNLWQKTLLPFFKTAGRETLRTSLGVAEDALSGKSVKESAKSRFKATGKELGTMALKHGQQMLDQDGAGKKRRKKRPVVPKKDIKKRRKVKKKSFGPKASKDTVAKYAQSISKVSKKKNSKRKKTKKTKSDKKSSKSRNLFPF
jgi:hypothetical protein